jgi:anionic cell wall polymer biosynthesis LytR-Cps2A-Psr (LCP) family protein
MGSERVNVAMYGYGGPEHTGGTYLADSIIILSIDPKTDTTTMIPIPRDLWIEGFPRSPTTQDQRGVRGRLRQGGVYEAGQLATRVLTKITGLPGRALDGARLHRVQGA